jgi:hypothetical protein
MADYQAAQQATRDRTAALRQARLARKATKPRNKQHEPDEQDE